MSVSSQAGNIKDKGQESTTLMEQIVSRENMTEAYRRIYANNGAPGVDGLEVTDLKSYLKTHWSVIKVALLEGRYKPQAVKQVSIPKPGGGERLLGIPTVVDRMIQQGIHQIINPLYDPEFSQWSYGFREGRSAHQAVVQSRTHIQSGKRWVIDMDLSKFFDEVDHERLLSKLRKTIMDRRVIHLIDRYLKGGIMVRGVETKRSKGTPQGSPLSPLLSNIVLDELDKELEKRGHKFVRYADDFQIYVGSERTAHRVMDNLTTFIENKLKLKINKGKSAIDRPWKRSFLGYSFTAHKDSKLRVAPESIKRLKGKLKEKFRQGRGRNQKKFIEENLNPVLKGWINYFAKAEVKGFAKEIDGWVRRHLRKNRWRQMKRSWTRFQLLMKRGISEERAARSCFNQRGSWWNSGTSHMNQAYPKSYFDKLGLVSLQDELGWYHLCIDIENRRIRNRTYGGVRGQK